MGVTPQFIFWSDRHHSKISGRTDSAESMGIRGDGGSALVPSLDASFSHEEISMDLTMCGLLAERAEEMAELYAAHRDWTTVEARWFDERLDGRSTRGSSRKIYRVLSSRFKTAPPSLPSVSRLPSVLNQCKTRRDKAQVLYFYLIEDDPLVKFAVHEYVRRLQRRGVDGLDFQQEAIERILDEFHYADGTGYDYAESTTDRWGEGLRSLMRDIGVIETQQSLQGQIPNVGTVPLLVASGYSWENDEEMWLSRPLGWLYLFQPEQYWDSLIERVSNHSAWETSGIHGDLRLQPVGETYAWAEPMEEAE